MKKAVAALLCLLLLFSFALAEGPEGSIDIAPEEETLVAELPEEAVAEANAAVEAPAEGAEEGTGDTPADDSSDDSVKKPTTPPQKMR